MPPSEDMQNDFNSELYLKLTFNGETFLTYIDKLITLEELNREIRQMCNFSNEQQFTSKWIDEDGDACTISSQMELDEAIRLYQINKECELVLYIFDDIPPPGDLCRGEYKDLYKAGRKICKKLYRISGHMLYARRFNKKVFCHCCTARIWGLRRQGLECVQCHIIVHKKCHKDIFRPCTNNPYVTSTLRPIPDNILFEPTIPVPILSGNQPHYSLNDFDLIKVIGRGSFAKVLMVELKKTKQLYAMKVIKKESVSFEEEFDWIQTEKLVFELASNHPFLIGLHSCFQSPSRLFFVIEFARGGDLMFHMQNKQKLPEFHVQFYAAEICVALKYLHSKGIVYRDLKLDNILLDHEGHIKLTDYGMCKGGITHTEGTSTFCGTPNYIAPEVLLGEEYGFSVDWWALGVLMFEMLAGRSPFSSDNPDHYTEDYLFQTILEKPIRIPRSLTLKATSILRGFLNKDPNERLGCRYPDGFSDIVNHPFFKSTEWDLVQTREVRPPFVPKRASEKDFTNFPPEFTREPVKFSPDDPFLVQRIDQSEFEGFDYVNPFLGINTLN